MLKLGTLWFVKVMFMPLLPFVALSKYIRCFCDLVGQGDLMGKSWTATWSLQEVLKVTGYVCGNQTNWFIRH